MSREIKFRQFCSEDDCHEYGMNYFDVYSSGAIKDGYWSDPMQYTGVKDKYSKEIYECDIVKCQVPLGGFWGNTPNQKIAVIKWNDDMCGFIAEWDYSKNQHHIDVTCDVEFEVIGNIHQNPELINT